MLLCARQCCCWRHAVPHCVSHTCTQPLGCALLVCFQPVTGRRHLVRACLFCSPFARHVQSTDLDGEFALTPQSACLCVALCVDLNVPPVSVCLVSRRCAMGLTQHWVPLLWPFAAASATHASAVPFAHCFCCSFFDGRQAWRGLFAPRLLGGQGAQPEPPHGVQGMAAGLSLLLVHYSFGPCVCARLLPVVRSRRPLLRVEFSVGGSWLVCFCGSLCWVPWCVCWARRWRFHAHPRDALARRLPHPTWDRGAVRLRPCAWLSRALAWPRTLSMPMSC